MRDRFRRESLVERGFARFTEPSRSNEPPDVVLNERERVRFGFQYIEYRQKFLDELDDELVAFLLGESGLPDLPKYSEILEEAQEGLEETLTGLARVSEAPYDPMTGQPFTRLPDKVKIIAPRDSFCSRHENSQQALHEQLIYVKNLRRRVEEVIESENDKRRQAEWESEAENLTELETDPEIRPEQETANGDRAVLATVPVSHAA